jgi:hypothetical protein
MQTVRLGFSRKSHLYAGLATRRIKFHPEYPRGAAGLTFGEGTVAGVFMEGRHII